jgi:hypothetical protein
MSREEVQGGLTWTSFLSLLAALGFFLLIIVVGMGVSKRDAKPSYFEGVITGKQWVPTRDETTYIMSYDASTGITNQTPIFTTHPEEWRIFIGSKWVRVPKDEFKKVEIGVEYSNRPKPK